MYPVVIENLKKSYGKLNAVKGISFDIRNGEIFGLIGPDGAGKTTILRSIVSLLVPDSGMVMFMEKEVKKNPGFVRSNIGYMPQRFSLYQDLTVEQNLRFFGDLFRVPAEEQIKRMQELYEFSKLGIFKNRRAGNLSGGMKQKLALSCMLIHEPEVVILDEPTYGVDPVSRNEFWEILHTLAAKGIALLVTTAYMDEASQCDRIGLIFEGELLACDKPEQLVKRFDIPIYLITSDVPHNVYEKLQGTDLCKDVQIFGNGVHFIDHNNIGFEGLTGILNSIQAEYDQIEDKQPDLENVFLNLMKTRDLSR